MNVEKKRRGRKPRKTNDEIVNINNNTNINNNSFSCNNELCNLIVQLDKVKQDDINVVLNSDTNINEYTYDPEVNIVKPYNEDISQLEQGIVNFQIDEHKVEHNQLNFQNKTINFTLINMKNSLFSKDNWPLKTDIHCWWCCHEFNTIPIGLPVSLNKQKEFNVIGCFCSFNCVLAYARNSNKYNNWLVHSLYRKLTKEPAFNFEKNNNSSSYFCNIKKAPPREALKKFGGSLTIDEFRDSFKNFKNYSVLTVPMISLGQKLEEKEDVRITKTDDIKKMKRDKPLQKKEFSLEHLMGIN